LGKTYLELKEYTKAVTSFERLLDLDPRDGDAASALRDAMAAKTHEEDWKKAEQGGYREALKDKKEAEQLEQQGKVVKSGSAIEDLIRLNFEKHQAEPTNPNHPKAIADLYLQKSDYPNAITWYTAAFEAGGKVDSSLEKTIGDLRLKQVEKELQQLEASKVQSDDPDQQAIHEATIQEKKKELDDVRLFQAEARVRAYPNEGQYHFELGEALFKVGRYQDALRELQMGKKQPSVRHKAMNLLGLSFLKLKMNDMAVRNFAEAANELPVMDDVKMEIVYNLGLAYEAIKQPDKALEECWKKIYDYDMGYRDVAKRVEESYSRES
jgi:tetratricopeptide (TPR) repeat protein